MFPSVDMNSTANDLSFSTAQIIPLATFCLLVATTGLLGNSVVLYSSFRYNAVCLDKISVILVRNLALADIMYCICTVLPLTVTYLTRRYILGGVYCFIMAHIAFIPGTVNNLTILTISCHRLRALSAPLTFRGISLNGAYYLVAVIWFFSTGGTVISLAYHSQAVFVPSAARCLSTVYTNPAAASTFGTIFILFVVIPVVLTTIFNLIMLYHVYKRSGIRGHCPRRFKGLVTVFVLSGLFTLSLTPFTIFTFMHLTDKVKVPRSLDLMAFHFIFLNVFGNPIMYTFTNRRFGEYVKGMISGIILSFNRGHQPKSTLKISDIYSSKNTDQETSI